MKKRSLMWLLTAFVAMFGLTACLGNNPVINATLVSGATTEFTVEVGDAVEINLSDYFTFEGDVTFSAESSSQHVTVSTVANNKFTFTASSIGEATVTVKALNNTVEIVKAELDVEVVAKAYPSVIKDADTVELTYIGSSVAKPISDYINKNNKIVIFSASVSNNKNPAGTDIDTNVVNAVIEGTNIAFTAVKAGSATVTLTGAYAGNNYVATFSVTVAGDAVVKADTQDRVVIDLLWADDVEIDFTDYFTVYATNATFAVSQDSTTAIKQISYTSGNKFTAEAVGGESLGGTAVTLMVKVGNATVAQKVINVVVQISPDVETNPTATQFITWNYTDNEEFVPFSALNIFDFIRVNHPTKTYTYIVSAQAMEENSISYGDVGVSITMPNTDGDFKLTSTERPNFGEDVYIGIEITAFENDGSGAPNPEIFHTVPLFITVRNGNPIVESVQAEGLKEITLDLLNIYDANRYLYNYNIFTSYLSEDDDVGVSISGNYGDYIEIDDADIDDVSSGMFIIKGLKITTSPIEVTLKVKLNNEVVFEFVMLVEVIKREAYEQKITDIEFDVFGAKTRDFYINNDLIITNIGIDTSMYTPTIENLVELSAVFTVDTSGFSSLYAPNFSLTPLAGAGKTANLVLKLVNVADPTIIYTFTYELTVISSLVELPAPTDVVEIELGMVEASREITIDSLLTYKNDATITDITATGTLISAGVTAGIDYASVTTSNLVSASNPSLLINAIEAGVATVQITIYRTNASSLFATGIVFNIKVTIVDDRTIFPVVEADRELELSIASNGTPTVSTIDLTDYYTNAVGGEAPTYQVSNPLGAIYFTAVIEGNDLILTPAQNTSAPVTFFVMLKQGEYTVLTIMFTAEVTDNRDVAIYRDTYTLTLKEDEVVDTASLWDYIYKNPSLGYPKMFGIVATDGQEDLDEFVTIEIDAYNGTITVTGLKRNSEFDYLFDVMIADYSSGNPAEPSIQTIGTFTIKVTVAKRDYDILATTGTSNNIVQFDGQGWLNVTSQSTFTFELSDYIVSNYPEIELTLAKNSNTNFVIYDLGEGIYSLYFASAESDQPCILQVLIGSTVVLQMRFMVGAPHYTLLQGPYVTKTVVLNESTAFDLDDYLEFEDNVATFSGFAVGTNVSITGAPVSFMLSSIAKTFNFTYAGADDAYITIDINYYVTGISEGLTLRLIITILPAPYVVINETPSTFIQLNGVVGQTITISSATYATIYNPDYTFKLVPQGGYGSYITSTTVNGGFELELRGVTTGAPCQYRLYIYEGNTEIIQVACFAIFISAV